MSQQTTQSISTELPTGLPSHDACIVQIYGEQLGRRHRIAGEVTIGRDESNTVVIPVDRVSRRHARLSQGDDGTCYVADLGSTNGTWVNGEPIEVETELHNGDLIKVGSAVFKFLSGGDVEALYHEAIYRMTIIDGLTQVHNQRYFQEFLEREASRARRHSRELSLVMLDVDDFKRFNDTFGHLAGDHLLKKIAELISRKVREEDLLARYGGDEFVLVLPETSGSAAASLAERIRSEVEATIFVFDGQQIPATISLGVASLRGFGKTSELIKAADERLYQAKRCGRNRVFAGGEQPGEARPSQIGPYRIEGVLGVGGMGEVYRAFDERLDRPVAIKHITSPLAREGQERERLWREARAVAKLNDPSIVQVYDIVDHDGSDWIVMELVEGQTLASLLRQGPLAIPVGLRLFHEVALGLAKAHRQGILHRDLKAENIMVTKGGHAKVLDFGLARRIEPGEDEPRLTAEGKILGTPEAMSPEQARGQPLDHRSDLFSLGTLLYEAFTGRHPFRGANRVATLKQVCFGRHRPARAVNPALPAKLSWFIDRLLEKDPANRPQDTRKVAVGLKRLTRGGAAEESAWRAPAQSDTG